MHVVSSTCYVILVRCACNNCREAIQGLAAGTVVPGVAGMGFGGGFWRCPGRFFAEMELALMLQLVLLQIELSPEQQQQQDPTTAAVTATGTQHDSRQTCSSVADFVQAMVPGVLRRWVLDVAVFGLGMRGGSSKQEQHWQASGVAGQLSEQDKAAADGRTAIARLPKLELRRLVGLKVPAEPWWVAVAGNLSEEI